MHRGILHPGQGQCAPMPWTVGIFASLCPFSYLSSDVFAVCKCLILLARWEPLTPWPVRSKHRGGCYRRRELFRDRSAASGWNRTDD